MEEVKPCVSCGKTDVKIDKLDMGDYANWFVKCENCVSVTTITHAVRENAIRQWNHQWVWDEIDNLTKRTEEAEAKESHLRRRQIEDQRVLQYRYETVLEEYIKYRMLYSGTAGNINTEGRKALMVKELASELGWTI